MTFKEFEAIVSQYRPDVKVYKRQQIRNRYVIPVKFPNSEKVYNYQGSYQSVITALGIKKFGREEKETELLNLHKMLEQAIEIAEGKRIPLFICEDLRCVDLRCVDFEAIKAGAREDVEYYKKKIKEVEEEW